ncbi:sel1 repeat family protein [Pseudomonas cavernicola]|uniref:Sel1 repeat family protein n=1 Tax=Pseudomonas cavernicola TaxID=2320866 RepID=A0A418XB22_9PSED|nr:SEL1-like repeat protein [Pseudomonas cavernicola]RJG09709.1 sel1 repeat family protein [Pseudomonas cavernicola]
MSRSGFACGLLGSVSLSLLSGCMTLPDLQLAKQAKSSGDLVTAEQNYRALAEQGYVDAQIGLADLLVRGASVEQQEQGEDLYRRAIGRSAEAPVRLGKWLASKPLPSPAERIEAEQLLRQGLREGDNSALLPLVQVQLKDPQKVNGGELDRQLAQWQEQGIGEAQLGKILLYRARGDYSQHISEIERTCESRLAEVSECYVELAGIYQGRGDKTKQQRLLERLEASYQSGRLPPESLQAVAKVLADSSFGEPDAEAAKALYTRITPVYADAWCSLAELLLRYPEQGGGEELTGYLQQGIDAGSSRAALMLGQQYLKGQVLPADPPAAEKYLLLAVVGQPRAHLLLGKLYREGQLGDIDPDKALEHLLIAARGGNPSADVALAQLFGEGKGIRINPVYAYTFALLAKNQGLPQGQLLMERLAPRLQPQDYQQVESLLAREIKARGGAQATLRNQTNQAQGML